MDINGMRLLLGAKIERLEDVVLPTCGSYKFDGYRAIFYQNGFLSRKLKKFRNQAAHDLFLALSMAKGVDICGYDGELCAVEPTDPQCLNKTKSILTSFDGDVSGLKYYVFDNWMANGDFLQRLDTLGDVGSRIIVVQQRWLETIDEILDMEKEAIDKGYEGLVLRRPGGIYKRGRASMAPDSQELMKLKRYTDANVTISGFEERMHNANEAKADAQGYMKRASHKANKVPLGTLGACLFDWYGATGRVGTGFTANHAAEIWANRPRYLNRRAKIKFFPVGMKELPREPVFIEWDPDEE